MRKLVRKRENYFYFRWVEKGEWEEKWVKEEECKRRGCAGWSIPPCEEEGVAPVGRVGGQRRRHYWGLGSRLSTLYSVLCMLYSVLCTLQYTDLIKPASTAWLLCIRERERERQSETHNQNLSLVSYQTLLINNPNKYFVNMSLDKKQQGGLESAGTEICSFYIFTF